MAEGATQFSSFGIPAIDEVGLDLDQKLAKLLDALKVEVLGTLRGR